MPAPSQTFLGLEFGGTKLQAVIGTPNRIVDRRQLLVGAQGAKEGGGKTTGAEAIRRQISTAMKELLAVHQPVAVGAGFGGPLDRNMGRICESHQISGWSNFSLAEWLESETGLPARIENDANLATWAEAVMGAGRGASSVFYVTLGSGVGAGLFTEGKLFHGVAPGEAEFGHLLLNREGATVESFCSGWAVDQRIRAARDAHPDSILYKLVGSATGGEARHLAAAWVSGDSLSRTIIDETGAALAFALSHVVHLMHPEVVVLGGGLSLVGEPLRAAVAGALPSFLMRVFQPGPRIELSALKEDVVPLGALLLAQEAASNRMVSSPKE